MQMPRGKRVVFSEEAIRQRTQEIGRKISQDYADKDLILVSVLKGSLYFFADLSRAIDIPVQLDFITIGAYPVSTSQKGIVRITKDLDLDITGRHVLVVEDIIRTGLTTAYLVQNLVSRMPASVKVCTLLVNPDQQMINVPIAYCGFEISETRLIGYGMDVGEWGRNLPYIAEINRAEP
jgi:hypoxanthine phosphoribosyltransferase